MLTRVGRKKPLQAHIEPAVLLLFEANGFGKSAFNALEVGVLHAAKVHKIQRGASKHELGCKIVRTRCGGYMVNVARAVAHTELANAEKFAVLIGGIRKIIRIVRHSALLAEARLVFLFLDRSYSKLQLPSCAESEATSVLVRWRHFPG